MAKKSSPVGLLQPNKLVWIYEQCVDGATGRLSNPRHAGFAFATNDRGRHYYRVFIRDKNTYGFGQKHVWLVGGWRENLFDHISPTSQSVTHWSSDQPPLAVPDMSKEQWINSIIGEYWTSTSVYGRAVIGSGTSVDPSHLATLKELHTVLKSVLKVRKATTIRATGRSQVRTRSSVLGGDEGGGLLATIYDTLNEWLEENGQRHIGEGGWKPPPLREQHDQPGWRHSDPNNKLSREILETHFGTSGEDGSLYPWPRIFLARNAQSLSLFPPLGNEQGLLEPLDVSPAGIYVSSMDIGTILWRHGNFLMEAQQIATVLRANGVQLSSNQLDRITAPADRALRRELKIVFESSKPKLSPKPGLAGGRIIRETFYFADKVLQAPGDELHFMRQASSDKTWPPNHKNKIQLTLAYSGTMPDVNTF